MHKSRESIDQQQAEMEIMTKRSLRFSTYFPVGHPKAGQKTFFAEKFYNALSNHNWDNLPIPQEIYHQLSQGLVGKKYHTIRQGNRIMVGDKVKICIWEGRPYHSRQITIHPGVMIKQIWHFETDGTVYKINGRVLTRQGITHLALSDGLTPANFTAWFNKPFKGQIVCWSHVVNYENEKSMDYVE